MTSIADFRLLIWWRGQAQFTKSLQVLQNLALYKILGVFKTAPIQPIEVEAALQPPSIRLNSNTRKFATRVLKLAPNHLIRQELTKLTASYLANQELDLPNKLIHKPAL